MDRIIIDPEKINVNAMASMEGDGFDQQQDAAAPAMRESTPMTIEAEDEPQSERPAPLHAEAGMDTSSEEPF